MTDNVAHNRRTLLQAVEDGEQEKVQALLDKHVSMETEDDNGNSLLQIAAGNGHEDMVRLLLKKGAALDSQNLYGWTALMQASRYGHENVVALLLKNKAEVNIKTITGVSALTTAVRGGNTKVVERLLSKNLVIDDADSVDYFCSPLMVATLHGRDELLRKLVQRGVPSDQFHKHTGWTPVMIAAMTDQLAMARLLVDKGCDVNRRNRLNVNALMIASSEPCQTKEVRGYLQRKTTDKPEKAVDPSAIMIAAVKKGNFGTVQEMLDKHPGVCNATSTDGATPVMYAAINGQPEMIKLLVRYGADVNARDYENGWTALMQATYYGKLDAAKCLLECGADTNIRTKNNITAFDMALIINTDTALFRLLAEKAMERKTTPKGGGVTEEDANEQYSTRAWQNTFSTDQMPDDPSKYSSQAGVVQPKGFLSKVTRTWKNNKLTRTLKNISSKVENFENTLIAPETDGQNKELNHGDSVTIADPYSMTNHSAPKSRLPEAKLSPIVPPFQEASGSDKQSNSSHKKMFGSKSSMSTSLNSSGESSVSRCVVKPSKFLYSPGNSGRYGNGSSPHSSGGASDVIHSFTLGHNRQTSGKEPHSQSGDRYSDTMLSKIAQDHQRKHNRAKNTGRASSGRVRTSSSAEQLLSIKSQSQTARPSTNKKHRAASRAGSTVSSHSSTSTLTLTPPHTPDKRSRASSRRSLSSRGSKAGRKPPSVSEEDELSGILRKLSLEKYHTIFEEQEIDMDTFLTLTNGDLRDMGITQELPQQQLLQVIKQLNVKTSGKRPGSNYSYSGMSSTSSRSSSNYNSSALPSLSGRRGKASSQWSYNSIGR